MTINEVKKICQKLGIRPTKSKGQNFLLNQDVVKRMIETADLNKQDLVLEIGPGLGILTKELVKRVGKVVAVELDKKLVDYLQKDKEIRQLRNLDIVEGDIVSLFHYFIVKLLGNRSYKVVANLPYQITSRVLRLLLESHHPPSQMVVMVQREVGERICAKPGEMSVLSVMVQYYAEPKIIRVVSKGNFWPRPDVDSVILRINMRITMRMNANENANFFKVVKLGFSSRRKMLKNNLGKLYDIKKVEKSLRELGLNPKVRAQELSVEEWVELYEKLVMYN